MNGSAKRPTSISFRPAFQNLLDKSARGYGISRSQLITRILGVVLYDLGRPDIDFVKISKHDLNRSLTI